MHDMHDSNTSLHWFPGTTPLLPMAANGDHAHDRRRAAQPLKPCSNLLHIVLQIQQCNEDPSCCPPAAAAWLQLRRRLPGARCAARCSVPPQPPQWTAGRLPGQRAGRLQRRMRQLLPPEPAGLRPARAGDDVVATTTHRASTATSWFDVHDACPCCVTALTDLVM